MLLDGSSPLLLLTAIIWGLTNPLIRRYSTGVQDAGRGTSWCRRRLAEILHLIRNPKYSLSFLANQLGSVLYLYVLSETELSLASPTVTALTFVITLCAGVLLGESMGQISCTCAGVFCVISGVYLCMMDNNIVKIS